MPSVVRAFVAIQIPASVREQLVRAQAELKQELPGVSWTRPESMHLTLHFFGDVESVRLPELTSALSRAVISRSELPLEARGVGEFGNRVIWAGLEGDVEGLRSLASGIRSAVADVGYKVEKREFNPHVTLGRVRVPTRGLRQKIGKRAGAEFGSFTVSEVELVRSELSPQGSRYTTLASFPLTSAI